MRCVGFTGTKRPLTPIQSATLLAILQRLKAKGYEELRHGDCINADAVAHRHAGTAGLRRVIHPPLVNALRAFCVGEECLPPRDYIARNHDIVDRSAALVACPEGPEHLRSGTWATIRYARKKGLRIIIVWPDGRITAGNVSA